MPRTNWDILASFKVNLPQTKKIEEFDVIVRPMIERITININNIHCLERLRDTLLPKLMSGEVRVNV